jgi:hypothetical protein
MRSSRPILIVAALTVILLSLLAQAQNPPASPPGTATFTFADGKTVTIAYSRPSMRGRTIFGGLVPYGKVWRTGANSATTLKTDTALTIGGASVAAGTYTLYSIPEEKKWTLIINKETGQWGTKYDQAQDLARVEMKLSKPAAAPVEQFTIGFDQDGATKAVLKLEWADTLAKVDVVETK